MRVVVVRTVWWCRGESDREEGEERVFADEREERVLYCEMMK